MTVVMVHKLKSMTLVGVDVSNRSLAAKGSSKRTAATARGDSGRLRLVIDQYGTLHCGRAAAAVIMQLYMMTCPFVSGVGSIQHGRNPKQCQRGHT